jgi:integrase
VDGKYIRKTFPTVAAARAWRQETQIAVRQGQMRGPTQTTLNQAAEEWLTAAEACAVRTRSGDPYKPSAIRAYRQSLNHHILPTLGSKRLSAISKRMLQDLADQLVASGLSASSVRNAIIPIRAIYRRALDRDEVAADPSRRLRLPAVRGGRDRIAPPTEATKLLNALPAGERALWATALYAGLRLGELQALAWEHVDLDHSLIHIERSWDRIAGYIEPKSRSGRRRVPITNTLRHHLLAHRLHQGTGGTGLLFTNDNGTKPFNPSTTNKRANLAWTKAGLTPITLHECRHSYAAYMIAAGINTKALSTYMGHASITITLDRYGHLLPGNENEAANLLETWLTQAAS